MRVERGRMRSAGGTNHGAGFLEVADFSPVVLPFQCRIQP